MAVLMRHPKQRRTQWLVTGGLAVFVLAAATPALASRVDGRIVGVAIPGLGQGEAFVRAVSIETGAVVAVDDVDATGRYRLTVPKGTFGLFPTVVTIGKVSSPKPIRVRLKRGQRKAVRLPARPAAVTVRPIVGMPDSSFTGATGEFQGLNRGLRDMLIKDIAEATVPDCNIMMVERSASGLAMIRREFDLVRLGVTDPATAPRPGLLVNPTRGVRGTFTATGGRIRIDAEVYKWSSKKTLKQTSVEGAKEEFFELEADLARKLAALLCNKPPPITGTFSGSLDYSRTVPVGLTIGTLDWSGSLELEPDTSGVGLPPQLGGPTATYLVASGAVTVRLNLAPVGGNCGIAGQGTLDPATLLGGMRLPALTVTDGTPDTYRLALDGGLGQVPSVLVDCPPDKAASNGAPAPWPLREIKLLPFGPAPLTTRTDGVFAGSTIGTTPGFDDGYQWTWSLRG